MTFQKGHKNYVSKEANRIAAQKRIGAGNGNFGRKFSEDHIEKLSLAKRGIKFVNRKRPPSFTKEHRAKIGEAHRGKKLSEETIKKISGANKPNWKGGISKIDKRCRQIPEYLQWRSDVFQRDNWTCKTCNKNKCYLNAHHIKGFSKILKENDIKTPEEARDCIELWNINNGVTLCEACHSLTDNYKGRANRNK